jgi:poly-gamma-glutamate synthesis protein (capsule biosynthesis protein)
LYRFFVDAGANAVVAHHTHIISGFERYKGAPIFYSLGNFCFDWEGLRGGTWNKGMVLKLSFEKGSKVEFNYHFIHHNDNFVGTKFVEKSEEAELENMLNKLNEIINDDDLLEAKFDVFANEKRKLMQTWIQPYSGKVLSGLYSKKLLPSLLGSQKRRLINILVKCESHRDLLLNSFIDQ